MLHNSVSISSGLLLLAVCAASSRTLLLKTNAGGMRPAEGPPPSLGGVAKDIQDRGKRALPGSDSSLNQENAYQRYRYPFYKKRAFYPPPEYVDELAPFLSDFMDEEPSSDYAYDSRPGKPSMFRERGRGKGSSLISNAHFSNHDRHSRFKKQPYFNSISDSPYDLNTISRFYHRGKRAVDPDEANDTRDVRFHSSFYPIPLNDKNRSNNHTMKNDSRKGDNPNQMGLSMGNSIFPDRYKRGFSSYGYDHTLPGGDDDFLTREYFKTIARTVGNKRKRMAYSKFEAPLKKSEGYKALLENPSMLHYVQEQLRDAEVEVAENAEQMFERFIQKNPNADESHMESLVSDSIAKLDAIEQMRDALEQLEHLEEKEAIRKRAVSLTEGDDDRMNTEVDVKKRRKQLKNLYEKRQMKMKKSDFVDELFGENKREECPVLDRVVMNCAAIGELASDEEQVFLEPCVKHEICYMCGSGLDVSRHECDALFSSALEAACSPLPTTGAVDCLSGASDSFNVLADPSRYDAKGTCTFDPCVRQLLDSR